MLAYPFRFLTHIFLFHSLEKFQHCCKPTFFFILFLHSNSWIWLEKKKTMITGSTNINDHKLNWTHSPCIIIIYDMMLSMIWSSCLPQSQMFSYLLSSDFQQYIFYTQWFSLWKYKQLDWYHIIFLPANLSMHLHVDLLSSFYPTVRARISWWPLLCTEPHFHSCIIWFFTFCNIIIIDI